MNTVIAAFQNLEVLSNFPVKCQNLLEKKKIIILWKTDLLFDWRISAWGLHKTYHRPDSKQHRVKSTVKIYTRASIHIHQWGTKKDGLGKWFKAQGLKIV